MDVPPAVIAVTGAAGVLAQRLLPRLDAMEEVTRVIGLDVREPARRMRRFEFHRVDIASHDLAPLLDGVDTVVHLAGIVEGTSDTAMLASRRPRRHAARARRRGNGRRAEVRADVERGGLRGLAQQSVADHRGGAAAAESRVPARAPRRREGTARRASGARSTRARGRRRLRLAPVVGPGAHGVFARAALGRPPVSVRGVDRLVQVVHVDDVAAALALAVRGDVDGACNVAADGWLAEDAVRDLVGAGGPALPDDLARRVLRALLVERAR